MSKTHYFSVPNSVPTKQNLLLIHLLARGFKFTLLSHEDSNLDRQNQKL